MLRWVAPLLLAAAVIISSYLFIVVLAFEDRAGDRTLSWFSPLVLLLRGVGRLAVQYGEQVLAAPVLFPLLGVAGAVTLLLLRRYRPRTWRQDIGLALVVPSFAATASLLMSRNFVPATLTGLLGGVCLAIWANEQSEEEPKALLFLIPLGLGAVLRFFALAQVPNGYAEHSVVHHAGLSIPYFEALSTSLATLQLQPFVGMASNALVREQWGLVSLIAALGFKLFGVSLVVTRLISAALGTLTIFVAHRLGRELGGVRLGLVFSFLLAVSPWHVAISRYGDQEHVTSPLQFLLALLFVLLAVKGGKVVDLLLAGVFTAAAWYIYASNLVVPAVIGLFLLYRALTAPRLALRNWWKILLAVGCFALLSYPAVRQLVAQGILQPNVRTGYRASGPILADLPKRLEMAGQEAGQLFVQARDPWFSTPGGGLGLFQSALLVAGLVLVVASLRQRRYRDLSFLVLTGLPIAALPAIFAPDVSFRRLTLVTTFVALVCAFTLVRIGDVARAVFASRMSRGVLTGVACVGAILVAATGTFGYFDRVQVGEELSNAWYRTLGEAVVGLLGKEPVVVVVPGKGHVGDTNRYITLMAYDTLQDAQRRGVSRDALYTVISCEGLVEAGNAPRKYPSPPRLIISQNVLEPRPPCGPDFLSRLKASFPGSAEVVARPAPLPADLTPAKP